MNLCRLCLSNIQISDIILIINDDIKTKIKDCVSVEINSEDDLPKTICRSCLDRINAWIEFKTMCKLSERSLREKQFIFQNIYAKKEIIKPQEEKEQKEEELELVEAPERKETIENAKNEAILAENEDVPLIIPEVVKVEVLKDDPAWKPFDFNTELQESDNEEFFDDEYLFNNSLENDDIKLNLDDNNYKCEICSKNFDSIMDLFEHQDGHDGLPVFSCETCNVTFNTKKDLADHEKGHKKPCPFCGKPILRQSLKVHINQHTDRFVCEQCSHRFNSKAGLNQHIIVVHTDRKDHICDYCGKCFSSKSAMNTHLKVHQEERQYKCSECSYAGRTASAIYIHMSKHANEVHVCDVCSKSFKSSRNLNDHLRRVHSKVKKHVCAYCKKKFVDKYMLKVHLRIHTGVRPFKCELCEKTFVRSDSLKEHLQTHDKNTFYECDNCLKKFTSKRGKIRHRCSSGA